MRGCFIASALQHVPRKCPLLHVSLEREYCDAFSRSAFGWVPTPAESVYLSVALPLDLESLRHQTWTRLIALL